MNEAVSIYITQSYRERLLDLVSSFDSLEEANEELHRICGIRCFFPDRKALEEFGSLVVGRDAILHEGKSRQWGDFQTPPDLASRICTMLVDSGISPELIIEPTYGTGNFIAAALTSFPKAKLIYGVEIQKKYEWQFKIARLNGALEGYRTTTEIELHQDNIFTHRFDPKVFEFNEILIVGNPPWVTNSELGSLDAANLPTKTNLKSLNGMDAVTGKSNFDLAEYVLLRMLDLFSKRPGRLALLCKNSVIKNLVEVLPYRSYNVGNIKGLEIDALREFGASVKASLLIVELGASQRTFTCGVGSLSEPIAETRRFGWVGNKYVSDIEFYQANSDLDGKSPLVWRQGLKHDCARIMELHLENGNWINGEGEQVDIESQYVYHLVKSSDLRSFEVDHMRKGVIVTQQHAGEDTWVLQKDAPRLWEYLMSNESYLCARKSSIYQGKPPFSIFGIGDYAFKPYKVAISGLYKEPCFSLVLPIENRPVMLDDTCYYLGFDHYTHALFTASLLSQPLTESFLKSIAFVDAKRPYTKEVLMRIDLARAAGKSSFSKLQSFWKLIGYNPKESVGDFDFEEYRQFLDSFNKPYNLSFIGN